MAGFNLRDVGITPAAIIADVERLTAQPQQIGISAADLLDRNIETIPCLVEPFLQKVGLACIAGSSDTGKSSLLRHLCMCIVAGKNDFLGFEIKSKHRAAIYLSTEDDETAISYLLHKQNIDMQLPHKNLEALRFVFDTQNAVETLDAMLTSHPADIVCIDAFTDLYSRSMNESNQVRGFLNEYSQLAQKHQCLVMFLHHCGKRTEEFAPSKHNLLGSQAFEAKMRLVMELRSDLADAGLKHLCIVKGNYLPKDYKTESFQLRFTENMTFENTNERVPFENLMQINDDGRQKYEQVKEYKAQGLSMEQIAPKVGFKSKGSVSKLIQKFENKPVVSETFPQETAETQKETKDEKLPF